MKRVLCFMAFAVLAIFSLAIISCGDDDEDANDGGNRSIIGTWKCDLTEKGKHIVDGYYGVEDYHAYYYRQFKEDGTYVDVSISYFKYSEELKDNYPELEKTRVDLLVRGTYKVRGNKIIETIDGQSGSGTATFEITGNKLKQTNKIGETWMFTKVNDTEINEYLTMQPEYN